MQGGNRHAWPRARCAVRGARCVVRGVRVCGGGTVGLEQLDATRLRTVDGGGAEGAVVMVHAAATQLDGLAW